MADDEGDAADQQEPDASWDAEELSYIPSGNRPSDAAAWDDDLGLDDEDAGAGAAVLKRTVTAPVDGLATTLHARGSEASSTVRRVALVYSVRSSPVSPFAKILQSKLSLLSPQVRGTLQKQKLAQLLLTTASFRHPKNTV